MAMKKRSGLRSNGATQTGQQRQEAVLYEALDYLDRVKLRYVDHPEIFLYFLETLSQYAGGRADYFGLIRQVSTHFVDNLDLIEAFNSFMPTGYRVECGAADGYLIVRITIPDGTSIDTKINLHPEGQGRFFNDSGNGFTPGQMTSPTLSAPSDTQIRLNVPEKADVEASKLQMLAQLASRPSIAETARDAVRAKYDTPSSTARPQSDTRPTDWSVPPNGTQGFVPPSIRFAQAYGPRPSFASPPKGPHNRSILDRHVEESSGSGSSRDSPSTLHKQFSPRRKLSDVSMQDASPVSDYARSRGRFQPWPSFAEFKQAQIDQKPLESRGQYIKINDHGSTFTTNGLPRKNSLMSSDPNKSPTNPDDAKIVKKSRTTKRASNGQQKTPRTHTNRAFPCPFATYGCPATFGSKNEWKRHINTQHMRLGYWRCDLCDQVRPNDFNRKDLFIQHMRRMHSTENKTSKVDGQQPKPAAKNDPEELALAAAANRCWRHIHPPPEQSSCLFCDVRFDGAGTWDERLEHIGRHMELIVKDGEAVETSGWKRDMLLEEWLIREEILVPGGPGKEGELVLAEGKM